MDKVFSSTPQLFSWGRPCSILIHKTLRDKSAQQYCLELHCWYSKLKTLLQFALPSVTLHWWDPTRSKRYGPFMHISYTNNTDWCLGVQQFWLYTAPMYTSSIHQKICGLIIPPVWPTAILSPHHEVMRGFIERFWKGPVQLLSACDRDNLKLRFKRFSQVLFYALRQAG